MRYEEKYFVRHAFTAEQIMRFLETARKDLTIATRISIPEVRFSYSYSALIKGGIALLSSRGLKVKSATGHHAKVIEKTAQLLKDNSILDTGNVMRTRRNLDLSGGGAEITEKETAEYLDFVRALLGQIESVMEPASGQTLSSFGMTGSLRFSGGTNERAPEARTKRGAVNSSENGPFQSCPASTTRSTPYFKRRGIRDPLEIGIVVQQI
jgi:hypothetical protein